MDRKRIKETKERIDEHIERIRPKDQFTTPKLRSMSRDGYELSMSHIIAIAKGEVDDAPHSARIRAHEVLGKSGLGDPKTIYIDHMDWLKTIYMITAKFLKEPEAFEEWYAEVQVGLRYKS